MCDSRDDSPCCQSLDSVNSSTKRSSMNPARRLVHLTTSALRRRWLCRAALVGLLGLEGAALAQAPKDIVWGNGQSLSLTSFVCSDKAPTLRIQGRLELVHPADNGDSKEVPEIRIECDTVEFERGSKVLVRAKLYIRAEVAIRGKVDIENRRGTAGADALRPASKEAIVRQRDGDPGPAGLAGANAGSESQAATGFPGAPGRSGLDGKPGQDGASGGAGANAARILLKARSYPGTTITLTARGGAGGRGADGGRGHDGGNGGAGGNGGKGGDGSFAWPPADGGSGGRGGNGGRGGPGGRGGDGGNGGAGGDLFILLLVDAQGKHGLPPNDVNWSSDGGQGGEPGLGGPGGQGGRGGNGGMPGCGGAVFATVPGFGTFGARCGEPGPRGLDAGAIEAAGAAGRFGREGVPGLKGNWQLAYIKS